MMLARFATPQDLRIVFNDLAQRCLDEVAVAGYPLNGAKQLFRNIRKADNLWALVFSGEVVGLIGFERSVSEFGQPFIGTSFLGREAFFQPAVPSVRFGRQFLRQRQSSYGNLPLVSMCYGTHPEIERWYGLMGYRLAETRDMQRNFVLDPVPGALIPEQSAE